MEMLRPLMRLLQPVLTAILEYAGLVDKNKHAWCSTCMSLGYLYERGHDQPRRPSPIVLRDRSFDDFNKSADRGCPFCDIVLQSFMLLDFVTPEMQVKLLLYADSPAELHGPGWAGFSEVIEIYPCSGKLALLGLSFCECSLLNNRHVESTRPMYPTVGKDVPRESTFAASVNFLKENYYTCVTDHEECDRGPSCLPKRIVDISKTRYRVVEPPVGTEGDYATLSYSWGSSGFAMTTSENYEEMKLGFDRRRLPIVFQDAAEMAQSLGICYLWIDTLCIVQDSSTDWEEQAARMGQIYEAAAITIAASLSTDPHHSLFQERERIYEQIELSSGLQGGPVDVVFKARRKIARGIHAKTGRSRDIDPLDTRAWGLQEKMLSTRLIAFTGAELQWTCRASKACECRHSALPANPLFAVPIGAATTNGIVELSRSWSQIIEEYSARELKFPEDRLPALSGLANKFGAETGYTYIAGGWKETLLYDLVWQRDLGPVLGSSTWIAPSWSWASSSGAVNFRLARHSYPGSRIEHTRLVDLDYKSAGNSPYSRALACSLTVYGHTVAALFRRPSHDVDTHAICIDGATYSPNTDKRAICEFSIDSSVPHYNPKETAGTSKRSRSKMYDQALDHEREEPITLLSLYSIHHRRYLYHNFLILAISDHESNTYRRIGIGSGKMYRGSGCEHDVTSEAQHVRPFEWLSIGSDDTGRKFGNMVEQVVRIR